MDETELPPHAGTVIADDYTIASEQSGLSADYVTTGSRRTDTGASSGGVTSSLGNSGGVVSWCVAGAGLTNQTGTSFFTGSTVDMGTFLPFDYQAVLREAFDAWSAVANIEFIQVADGAVTWVPAVSRQSVSAAATSTARAARTSLHALFSHRRRTPVAKSSSTAETRRYSRRPRTFSWWRCTRSATPGLDHVPSALAVMNATFNPSLTDDIIRIRSVYGSQNFGANVYYMPTGQTSLTLIGNCLSLTGGGNSIIGSNGERFSGVRRKRQHRWRRGHRGCRLFRGPFGLQRR